MPNTSADGYLSDISSAHIPKRIELAGDQLEPGDEQVTAARPQV
jgi:hypothetical protein